MIHRLLSFSESERLRKNIERYTLGMFANVPKGFL